MEHDQNIYGCVALKTFVEPDCGELACLVVSPEARDGGYGELLLEHLFQKARALNIKTLFALSTHTGEWFVERGFQTASADVCLPSAGRNTMPTVAIPKYLFMTCRPSENFNPIIRF